VHPLENYNILLYNYVKMLGGEIMGFFDLFKKKERSVIKCAQCFREVGETKYWKIDGKQYCQECYTKKISLKNQNGGNLSEHRDFKMPVEDVVFVKNRGVVLTGRISSGTVCFGDMVTVNDKEYKVIGIEMFRKLVNNAKEGDNIGLLIETFDPQNFKRDDIVSAPKKISETKDTFVCKKCKRELTIKYLHKINICAECFDKGVNEKNGENAKDSPKLVRKEFKLGNFSFEDADRQKIRAVAIRHLPIELKKGEEQFNMLNFLSSVTDISETASRLHLHWQYDRLSDEFKEERFKKALVNTVLTVDHVLKDSNTEVISKKTEKASCEQLLKVWGILDYYVNALKPEHTQNIQHFRDFIHNALLKFENNEDNISPIMIEGKCIYFDSKNFSEWEKSHPITPQFEFSGNIPLTEKEPIISFYEDGVKTVEYCLQTEGEEDFTGKYFLISVRAGFTGNPPVPTMQMDGFISDTPNDRKMTLDDIGYRMEGHLLACGGDLSKQRRDASRGQDLVMKGLKYQGYITPANIRLIGICPDCGKSFAFHGYAFYMTQSDVAYSDDGLDVCEIVAYDIDKESWEYETEGKTFRYYNSFNCPHCGVPYIDYKKHPENKVFGVSGCVHLGRKYYTAE